jgi:hypothetical protein
MPYFFYITFSALEQIFFKKSAFIHSSTGPEVHPLTSRHEGPGFNPWGGTNVKPGLSC